MKKKQENFLGNVIKGLQHRINKAFNNKYKNAGLSWYKIKYLKHLPYDEPHTFDLKGNKVYFNNGPELLHSLKEIFIEEIYKIDFQTPNPYILDCGANIGLAAMYLKKRYPHANIISFEPDKQNFSYLQKNLPADKWSPIQLINKAVWKENTVLHFASEGTLSSKIAHEPQRENTNMVEAIRLKDLLNRKVDFLKIDIEGAEYEALKDCADSLNVVQYLFIEFHGHFNKMHELTEILEIIQKNKFCYYIKEATSVYDTPFSRANKDLPYDIQLNIFCFR